MARERQTHVHRHFPHVDVKGTARQRGPRAKVWRRCQNCEKKKAKEGKEKGDAFPLFSVCFGLCFLLATRKEGLLSCELPRSYFHL